MIVVVGNGRPGAGDGPRIDQADFIIRCNDAWRTIGGDRGTRTSALCTKDLYHGTAERASKYREWTQTHDIERWICTDSPLVNKWVERYGQRFSRGMMAIIMAYERLAVNTVHVASCDALMSGLPETEMHWCGKRMLSRPAPHDYASEKRLLDEFCREHNVTLEVLHGDPYTA